jgi:Protein of unknown function (DUF2975)
MNRNLSGRLARRARWLRWVIWIALGLLVALHLLMWLTGSPQLLAEGFGGNVIIRVETDAARIVGMAVTLPATLLMAYGLYRLARMLGCFERGEIFSLASVGHLRAFGMATVLSSVASLLESPLLGVLLGSTASASEHRLQVVIRSADLWTLMIGALMFVIGEMMVEAQRIAADNAAIV